MNYNFGHDPNNDIDLIHEIYSSGWASVTETSLNIQTPISQKLLIVTSLKKDIQEISVNEKIWVELVLFRTRLINGIQLILKSEITDGLFSRLRIISDVKGCTLIQQHSADGRVCSEREESAKNIAIILIFIRRLLEKNQQAILKQDLVCRKLRDSFQLKVPPIKVDITSPGYSKVTGNFMDKLTLAIKNDNANNIYTILSTGNSKSSYMVSRTKNIRTEVRKILDYIGAYLNSENIVNYKTGAASGKLWDRYTVYPNHSALQEEFKHGENSIFKLFDRSINNPRDSECLTDYSHIGGGLIDAQLVDSVIWLASILNCGYSKAHELIMLFLKTNQTIQNAVLGSFGSKESIIGVIVLWISGGGSDTLHGTNYKLLITKLDGSFELSHKVLEFVVRRCNAIELIHDCSKDDAFSFHSHINYICGLNNLHHHDKTTNCYDQPGLNTSLDSRLYPYTHQNLHTSQAYGTTAAITPNHSPHIPSSHGGSHNAFGQIHDASGTVVAAATPYYRPTHGHTHDAAGAFVAGSLGQYHQTYAHTHTANGVIVANTPIPYYQTYGHTHDASGSIVADFPENYHSTYAHTHDASGITVANSVTHSPYTYGHTHDSSGAFVAGWLADYHQTYGHTHDASGEVVPGNLEHYHQIYGHTHNASGDIIPYSPVHYHQTYGHSHDASGAIVASLHAHNHHEYSHAHNPYGPIAVDSLAHYHMTYGHTHDASGKIVAGSLAYIHYTYGHAHNASGEIVADSLANYYQTYESAISANPITTTVHPQGHIHNDSGVIIQIPSSSVAPPHIHGSTGISPATISPHTHDSSFPVVSTITNIPYFSPTIKDVTVIPPGERSLGHNYAFNERPTVAKDASGVSIIRGNDIYNKLNALLDFYKLYQMDLYSIRVLIEIIQSGEYSFANHLAKEYKTNPMGVPRLIKARNNRSGPFQYVKLNGYRDFHYTRRDLGIGTEGFLTSIKNNLSTNSPLTYAEFLDIFGLKGCRIWKSAEKSAIDVLAIYFVEWANNLERAPWIKNAWDLIVVNIGVFPGGLVWNEYRRDNLFTLFDAVLDKGGILVESAQTRKIKRAILDIQ